MFYILGRRRRTCSKTDRGFNFDNEPIAHNNGSIAIKLIDNKNTLSASPSIKRYFKTEGKNMSNKLLEKTNCGEKNLRRTKYDEISLFKKNPIDMPNKDEPSNVVRNSEIITSNGSLYDFLIDNETPKKAAGSPPKLFNESPISISSKTRKSTTPHRILCPSSDTKCVVSGASSLQALKKE